MKTKIILIGYFLVVSVCFQNAFGQFEIKPNPKKVVDFKDPELMRRLSKSFPTTEQSINELIKGKTDGTVGFYLREAGKPQPRVAQNADLVIYPASTIKVFEHIYAIQQIKAGKVQMDTLIDFNGKKVTLKELINKMMLNSDNEATDVLQDYFTTKAINQSLSSVIGIKNSSLNHKFACGVPCGPSSPNPNKLTLEDAARLYESVALNKYLQGDSIKLFHDNMINDQDGIWLISGAIDLAAADLNFPSDKKEAFRKAVKIIWKSGGIPASYDGFLYESSAGSVMLPWYKPNSAGETQWKTFLFGTFINKAKNIDNEPPVYSLIYSVMLRQAIKEAMQGWK